MRALVTILSIVASLLAVGGASAQQQRPDADQPILFTADRLTHDRELGVVTASGNVEISQEDRILLADTVSYNERQDVMSASGNVSLVEPTGDVIFAEFMELTGDLKDGIIYGLRIRLADNSRVAAAGARRTAGNRTEMRNAVYSACDACATDPGKPPLWQLKAKRVVHDQTEKTIEYADAWLELAGVPVAYTPYFSHADPTVRRKTGFLAPTAGSASSLGYLVSTPFFWNIAPNRDLTVTPTLTTKERAVLAGEYRALERKSEINAKASGTYDSNDEFRGHIDSSIKYHVNETWRWGGVVQRATDDTYLRRYGFASPKTLTSNLSAEAFRGRDYAAANAYAFQGLQETDDPGQTPFVLPMLEFNHVGYPGAFGQYTSLDASTIALTRSDGADTRRMSVKGGWHVPYYGPFGSVMNFDASLRGDLYHVNGLSVPNQPESENGFEGRLLPQLGAGWELPLVRQHGSVSEILQPMAAIHASPNGGNRAEIPNEDSLDLEFDDLNLFSESRFAGLDRVEGGVRASYGLKWGVYGVGGGSTEVFVGQSYRFTDDDTFPEGSGLEDPLSDYVARLRVAPGRDLALSYRTRLDKDSFKPRRNEVSLQLGPPAFNVAANYGFFDRQTGSEFGGREEISGSVRARLTRFWRAGFAGRQDLESGDVRSLAMNVVYECECFTFDATLTRDFYEDRDLQPSDSIIFRITFKTLGDVQSGSSLSGLF